MNAIRLDKNLFRLPPDREDPDWKLMRHYDQVQLWDPSSDPRMATAYRIRIETTANSIARHAPAGARMLDVGCAQGTLGLLLAAHGFKASLLDIRPSCIEYAQARHVQGEVEFIPGTLDEANPPRSDYDVVTCTEVIEHTTHPARLLALLSSKCRPGGLIALTTPNADYALSRLPTFGRADQALIDDAPEDTDDGDDHHFLYTREELVAVLRAVGLQVLEHAYMIPLWQEGHRTLRPAHALYQRTLGNVLALPPDLATAPEALRRRLCSSQLVIARKPA